MAKITINGISIDPAMHQAALAAANLVSASAASSNFILVQARQPLTASQREQLDLMGAKILEYVPENTFICQYPPSDLASIRALPFVEWANVYLEGFKVPTSLRPGGQSGTANLLSAPPLDLLSNDRVMV